MNVFELVMQVLTVLQMTLFREATKCRRLHTNNVAFLVPFLFGLYYTHLMGNPWINGEVTYLTKIVHLIIS
jgi:hypothetical protein